MPVNSSFVLGDKYRSICIHPLVDVQLDLQHLLKIFSFFFFHCMTFMSKSSVGGCVTYFWVFDLIPLTNLFISIGIPCSFYSDCSVVRLETRDDDTSRNYFIIYSHLAFFVFDRKLRIAVSHSVSNCVGILVGNVLGGKMVLVKWLFSPC